MKLYIITNSKRFIVPCALNSSKMVFRKSLSENEVFNTIFDCLKEKFHISRNWECVYCVHHTYKHTLKSKDSLWTCIVSPNGESKMLIVNWFWDSLLGCFCLNCQNQPQFQNADSCLRQEITRVQPAWQKSKCLKFTFMHWQWFYQDYDRLWCLRLRVGRSVLSLGV